MKKLKLKFIVPALLLAIFMVMPSFASAVTYNSSMLVGQNYNVNARIDDYTKLYNQNLQFSVVKIDNSFQNYSDSLPIEGYQSDAQPAEWHPANNVDPSTHLLRYGVKVLQPYQNIDFLPYTADNYSQVVKGSKESLYFEQDSIVGYQGVDFPASAWTQLNSMSIGEISFDVMAHLNVSNAIFDFSLDNVDNNSKMVNGFFELNQTRTYPTPQYKTQAFIYPVGNATGVLSSTPVNVYNTSINDFDWIHVNLFFDTWNDLYNITFQQYKHDFTGYVDSPVSYVVRGDQHNGTQRTDTGARLSAGNLLNKLQFQLISNAYNAISRAWIDNITYRYYEFPSVYANVIYSNSTFGLNPSPEMWANNSIITSYEGPQYPSTVPIEFCGAYFDNYTRPNLLTGWEKAPTWMYTLPFIVPTNNNTLVNESLYNYLTNSKNHLEDSGTLKPDPSSDYALHLMGPFSSMKLTYNSVNSSNLVYYYDSQNTNYTIMIKYMTDPADMGVLSEFNMYQVDPRNPSYIDFLTQQTVISPGYPIFIVLGVAAITVVFVVRKVKKSFK